MQDALLVISNLPDASAAESIARQLLQGGLAACINIVPAVRSLYRWEGRIEEATEITLLIKTTRNRYDELEAALRASHPYETPEIIIVPIVGGLPAYLNWVNSETQKDVDV